MVIPGNTKLFEGIEQDDIMKLLACLAYRQVSAQKGSLVIREGDSVDSIGIILSGAVQIVRVGHDGQRIIQAGFARGSIFAESFVCAGIVKSPVSVVASADSEILFLPFRKLIGACGNVCSFHSRVIENLMKLIAQKNLMLNGKIAIISKRTTREKVLAYLLDVRKSSNAESFDIPFDRNELADYLCVDRSALSRELGRMQREGLVHYQGNTFKLGSGLFC